jgi:hypothetical protein
MFGSKAQNEGVDAKREAGPIARGDLERCPQPPDAARICCLRHDIFRERNHVAEMFGCNPWCSYPVRKRCAECADALNDAGRSAVERSAGATEEEEGCEVHPLQ